MLCVFTFPSPLCILLYLGFIDDNEKACISGIEARGFIFGPPIALEIGAKFVPLRKPKKLPGNIHHSAVFSQSAVMPKKIS